MSKYYKADEVIEKIRSFGWYEAFEIAEGIKNLSTIDIVPCEECRYAAICLKMVDQWSEYDGEVVESSLWVRFCSEGDRQ